MRLRLFIVVVLLILDLFYIPGISKLALGYLTHDQSAAVTVVEWRKSLPLGPVKASIEVLRPTTKAEVDAHGLWLALQMFVGLGVILLLWPKHTGLKGTTRAGVPNPDESGAHGSARWRSQKEASETIPSFPFRKRRPPTGFLAGVDREKKPGQAFIIPGPSSKGAKTNPHVLVLGGSGAGKTRRLVFPTLWLMGQAKESGQLNSMVITDPKGELYSYTAQYFRDLGYRVETLNLIHSKRSSRYNPVSEISLAIQRGDLTEASDTAWELAFAFTAPDEEQTGDSFWSNAAQSIVAAAVLYVAAKAPPGQRNLATVYRLITELGQDGGQGLDAIFRAIHDVVDPAKLAYGVTALSSDKTRASILTTAAVNLRLFADPSVAGMTASSDYDLSAIGQEPTVVFLLLPDDKSGKNAVAALYIQQMYSALSRLANVCSGGRLPVPVYFILDEFANIGKFKDFDKMISVMRGRGMAAMIVLQALQQLAVRYGEETAQVITANCDTWLFLKTNDFKTAEEISKKIGECTIRTQSNSATSRPMDLSASVSEQLTARSLLTPDEVLRWTVGQVLVMQAGQYPVKLSLADVSEYPTPFHEGPPPPEREEVRVSSGSWLPTSQQFSQFGGGTALEAPAAAGGGTSSGTSLLDRIRKGGSQGDAKDGMPAGLP